MRDHLVFYVNATRHTVRGDEAGLTLSDFLRQGRSGQRLCGTKIACAEGDCGACTVLVGTPDGDGKRFVYRTIDACIAFVYQLDCKHIVTVEGLASEGQLNAAQQAMVDCHGSQCGFCTPGFVMALQGLVEEQEDGKPLSDDQLRLGLSGNLCRCTGYSQILDAGHAIDPAKAGRAAATYDTQTMLAEFAEIVRDTVHVNAPADVQTNGHPRPPQVEALLPKTLAELLEQRAKRPDAKLVSGATDVGVQFNHGKIDPASVIVTHGVEELRRMEVVDGVLESGAAVTWDRLEEFSRDALPEYYDILTRFGSPQVRHAGTLVGNLANASPIADSIPFHFVAESTIELASTRGARSVPIDKFYKGYKQLDLADDEVITGVRTPLPTDSVQVKLYKVSKRRDMDISTATLAFWLELDGDLITTARIAAGGVGPTVIRLPRAEETLTGEPLTLELMQEAGRLSRDEFTPLSDVRGSDAFRWQLIENLFAKCWHDVAGTAAVA
ncbi:MAG: FAD binding domain-containing protein [Planctomycetota bacterium]